MALMVALLAALPSWAADEDDFYRGKTITIIIPIGPGGAYDAYARLVSRHLGKQLPGNPLIIARNMPGGGGVIASNHLYNVAPRDGTALAIITSSFANEQLFGNPQIRYDARQFQAIGRLLDTTSVLFFWHTSPIKTLNDVLTKPATMAISSVNEIPAYRLTAMNRYLHTQLKAIPGYPSARDYVLASERGETDGGTSTYIGLSQLFSHYLRDKTLNILVQFALHRDPHMPDVPTVLELARDPVPALSIRRAVPLHGDVGPGFCILCVELQPSLETLLRIRLDRIGRALGLADAAVDALVRMDHQHVLAFVEAVHGTDFHAVHVFAANATIVDDVGHWNSARTAKIC